MEPYIVAVSIDKVQSFLYYVLHAHVQDKQTNSGTLQSIIESSKLISDQFYLDIGIEGSNGYFAQHIDEELLKCSGMCVFTTSLAEEQIIEKLDALFKLYYTKHSGNLLLKYVYFRHSHTSDKLQAIKESKKRLREKSCLNTIIARNRDMLFKFCKQPKSGIALHSSVHPLKKDYNAFTDEINALFSEKEASNDNHFRIAVIKADLDGMGELFERIEDYNVYKQISDLLSKYISLEHLHEKVRSFKKVDPTFKLYPLYIAGDDIFFAVSASQLIDGVKLCKNILDQINRELEDLCSKSNIALESLSMSVGIDFTFNREPIRYYYERVQEQLDFAKAASRLTFNEKITRMSYMKVSINKYVMYYYVKPKDKNFIKENADKANLGHFIHQVKRLQQAMHEGFAAHHFFYGLLNKITDPVICSSAVKYSNAVLYHIIPEYLGSSNKKLRESELLILEATLKQVLMQEEKRIKNRSKSRKEGRFCFGVEQRNRLEAYVRLLLLFSDPRFQITKPGDEIKLDANAVKRVKSTLFNKSLRFLYENNLGRSLKLRRIFVRTATYVPAPNARKVEVYCTLRISNSLLHRLKSINEIGKVSNMIEASNHPAIEESESIITERQQGQFKSPPALQFDKEQFQDAALHSNSWNSDYIDSLLIFYQLREKLIQFKRTYASKKTIRR